MTDQPQADTPDAPDTAPAEPETEPAKPKKKKSRIGDIITVLVLLAIVLPTVYFWAEVSAGLQMQVWSKSGPKGVMTELQEAMTSGDVATAEKYLRPDMWAITAENGKITQVRETLGSQAKPLPIEGIAPSGSLDDAEVRFRIKAVNPGAEVTVATSDGNTASYMWRHDDTGWYIIGVRGDHLR